MEMNWTKGGIMEEFLSLYDAASEVLGKRQISSFINAGSVAAALLTDQGNIYVGVCINTSSSMGICAERNAMANMITNGENKIRKIVAVEANGNVCTPCGVCREYMMQLGADSKDIEILMDKDTMRTVRLEELVPDWWGYSRL